MKFSYEPGYNVAYIRFLLKSPGVESIKVGDELIVDMTPEGTVYGIELFNANEQLGRGDGGMLLVANDATGEEIEVALSVA